jgi:hypothetical protein
VQKLDAFGETPASDQVDRNGLVSRTVKAFVGSKLVEFQSTFSRQNRQAGKVTVDLIDRLELDRVIRQLLLQQCYPPPASSSVSGDASGYWLVR